MNELKRLQELLVQSHKNTATGTLTSGIAHEINNPINNIVLTLETLIEDNQTIVPRGATPTISGGIGPGRSGC